MLAQFSDDPATSFPARPAPTVINGPGSIISPVSKLPSTTSKCAASTQICREDSQAKALAESGSPASSMGGPTVQKNSGVIRDLKLYCSNC